MISAESLGRPNSGGLYIDLEYDKPCETCPRGGQKLAERIGHSIHNTAGMGKATSQGMPESGIKLIFKKGRTEKICTATEMADFLDIHAQIIYTAKSQDITVKGWQIKGEVK